MRVKICGITNLEQGLAIVNSGADTLGFICVAKSPRYVNNEIIKNIIQQLPKEISKIGIFVNENIDNLIKTVQETGLTGIQLHGEESTAFCAQLREFLPDIEIIKAFRYQNPESLALLDSYIPVIDTILLDAYQQGVYGGTGKILNWLELLNFRPSRPWLLAGGINPDNVLNALEILKCDGIDVSSGVEISPGNKDLDKIRQLFQKLNTLKNQLNSSN
ncbi:phosphoribosylanthranilate isomerase [Geminocystis sp. NIES-3708]|uniref:phosphoribosylanthranilate isomerase n=1 Tax=Geminocystis sp. NIES-3708 TaxID=1615909 RepID=UPI0005FC9BC8|nr:phosphoribosylanthranilate isomerase [Geminocystis sp. NIES-3708]BAQ62427.1 phosphoribosylanthranilate isomerase [Geminocystis sp. NIES-3708]